MLLAGEEDVHPVSSNTEDISGVFVDVFLEVDDVFRPGQKGSLSGLGLSILLKGFPVEVGVHLVSIEEEKTNLIEVLMFQSKTKVRELLVSRQEGPILPDGVLEERNVDLVLNVEGEVFQAIEQGSQSGGFPTANPGQGANSFLGEDLVDADGEDIAPVPWVP